MRRTDKKGFTIVELVIVIAVIAILAAVLIPNLSKMVKNAKESSDIQLIRNMNTAMQVESVGGTKHYDTAHDAITAAAAAGYDLTKISLSDKENTILWDEENQCFAYLRKGETTPEYVPNSKKDNANTPAEKLWKVETEVKENGDYPYSVYWNGENVATINVKNVGFDAGIATVETVNYTGDAGKTVVIRTNGGTLNIDAQKDTVHHYDFVMTLSVESVSETHCYYEHGFVGALTKFERGKFVTTSTAQFFQTEEEISSVLSGKEVDFSVKPAYSQDKYDEEGISIISHKPGPNHVHKWDDGEVTKDSSCGEEGLLKFTCTTCGKVEEKAISASGAHTWGEDNKCTMCGQIKADDSGEAIIVVDSFAALKNIIENIEDTETKTVKFSLGANLAFSKTTLIKQPKNTIITLDLNGYTLTLYNSKYDAEEKCYTAGLIAQGLFEICDSSEAQTGKIIASKNADNDGDGGLITVEKTSASSAYGKSNNQFVLQSGTIDSSNNPNGCAILMWHNARVTIDGGTIKAKKYAISGSVEDTTMFKGRLVINDGNIVSEESYAIYHPQCIKEESNGIFEINGGTFYGKNGVIYIGGNTSSAKGLAAESGTVLKINGGQFASDGDCFIYVNSTYLSSKNDYTRVQISVTGGTFTANNGSYFIKSIADKYVNKNSSKYATCYLAGGTFINLSQESFAYSKDYASKGATPTENGRISAKYRIKFAPVNGSDGSWSVEASD